MTICRWMVMVLLVWTLPAVAADLTGKWLGDDGATYYLREMGDDLYWYAEGAGSPPRTSVFVGKIQDDRIMGVWIDVPKGKTNGSGQLFLAPHHDDNVLEATRMTGGFSATKLVRAGYKPPPPPFKPTCVDFDPDQLAVKKQGDDFRIMQGDWWLFGFGPNEDQADTALKIIRQYGMSRSCFIGDPQPTFRFLLIGARAPLGAMYGEDCVPFQPTNVSVVQHLGRWSIVDGDQVLFDFGDKEKDARSALAAIRTYEFSNVCYVGRPNPTFEYLRR